MKVENSSENEDKGQLKNNWATFTSLLLNSHGIQIRILYR